VPTFVDARARHEKAVKDQEILRHLDFETPGWADIND
jgi:hypothetical protein